MQRLPSSPSRRPPARATLEWQDAEIPGSRRTRGRSKPPCKVQDRRNHYARPRAKFQSAGIPTRRIGYRRQSFAVRHQKIRVVALPATNRIEAMIREGILAGVFPDI